MPATSNFSNVLTCGLLSTVSRVLVPAFTVGVEESTYASSVGAKVNVPPPPAAGVVAEAVAAGDLLPAASTATTE